MRKYYEDWKALCEHNNEFYKHHWFGTIVLTVGMSLGMIYGLGKWCDRVEKKSSKAPHDNDV